VGLGDFVLQPQGMFVSDVFRWTALCLNGFVIVSSFLAKVGDLLQDCWTRCRCSCRRGGAAATAAATHESLDYHLARTDLWGNGLNTPISKSLEILKEMVQESNNNNNNSRSAARNNFAKDVASGDEQDEHEQGDKRTYRTSFRGNDGALAPDGNTINHHRIRILIEKKNLLIELLDDAQSELEDRIDSTAATSTSSLLDRLGVGNHDAATIGDGNGDGDGNGTVDNSSSERCDHAAGIDPLALHLHQQASSAAAAAAAATSMNNTVKEMQYQERVLESAWVRTKKVRTDFEAFRSAMETVNECESKDERRC